MVWPPDNDAIGSVRSIKGLGDLWAETTGDPRVTIAVLDGPVDRTHPALVGADLTTVEVTVPAVPRPGGSGNAAWHSGGEPDLRPARISKLGRGDRSRVAGGSWCLFSATWPGASRRPRPTGSSAPTCSQLDLARAILLAAEHGARVINISGGQDASSGTAHPILADAVSRCIRRGILVVAAAGNDGCECVHIPAAVRRAGRGGDGRARSNRWR